MITESKFKRSFAALCVAAAAIGMVGCANPGLTVNYSPSSVKSAQGSLDVGEFKYSAVDKSAKPMPPKQIRNTAMGEIVLDREVAKFVRDGVFAELRFVGIKMVPEAKQLTGDVQEFVIDDLGYSIDWTFRIKYDLTDKATGKVVYSSTKLIQRKTDKFGNPLGALNETIKLSVEQLLDDAAFVKAIN